jgi:hypothetical protein
LYLQFYIFFLKIAPKLLQTSGPTKAGSTLGCR